MGGGESWRRPREGASSVLMRGLEYDDRISGGLKYDDRIRGGLEYDDRNPWGP